VGRQAGRQTSGSWVGLGLGVCVLSSRRYVLWWVRFFYGRGWIDVIDVGWWLGLDLCVLARRYCPDSLYRTCGGSVVLPRVVFVRVVGGRGVLWSGIHQLACGVVNYGVSVLVVPWWCLGFPVRPGYLQCDRVRQTSGATCSRPRSVGGRATVFGRDSSVMTVTPSGF